jgi:hypothetical protein
LSHVWRPESIATDCAEPGSMCPSGLYHFFAGKIEDVLPY